MADIALDADGLRRDRERYHALLEQAEQQIEAWNERADHLQQAIDGLDRLLALAGDDPAQDGGVPRGRAPGRGVAPQPGTAEAPARKAPPDKPKAAAKKAPSRPSAAKPPPPTATPAAPDPVEPPAGSAAEAPKGTDALRTVFESAPGREWSLADLIEALEAKGWLPTSRRPEEGVRISLKRLAERGGVVRTEDGRWRLTDGDGTEESEAGDGDATWPAAEEPPAPEAPAADAAPAAEQPEAQPPPPPPDPPPARPASFGRPVGGTVTEI